MEPKEDALAWMPSHKVQRADGVGIYLMLFDSGNAYTVGEWVSKATKPKYRYENKQWLFCGRAIDDPVYYLGYPPDMDYAPPKTTVQLSDRDRTEVRKLEQEKVARLQQILDAIKVTATTPL